MTTVAELIEELKRYPEDAEVETAREVCYGPGVAWGAFEISSDIEYTEYTGEFYIKHKNYGKKILSLGIP